MSRWQNRVMKFFAVVLVGLIAILLINCSTRQGNQLVGMPPHVYLDPDAVDAKTDLGDSVTLRATDIYESNQWRNFWQGEKYRAAWFAPVTIPVAWLDTLKGGLTPEDKGGGFQTLSLDLVDSAGYVYTIRSVAKNPEKLIKPWMKNLSLENVVVDGIAAGHPYGAMVIGPLSEAAGVAHMSPKLYFVPRQNQLAEFDSTFGGRMYWLEFEPEGDVHPSFDVVDNIEDFDDSEKVLDKWHEEPTLHIPDLEALVRARLFDIWVGDWDRHDGQWGWIQYEDGDVHRYYPVPNDRDNVFYKIDGVFPSVVRAFEKRLQPFGTKVKSMDGLTANSAYFDYSFLHGVEKEVFIEQAKSLMQDITDEEIEASMRTWPAEVFAEDGPEIIAALKARREDLVKYATKFHRLIQKRGKVQDREEH